MSIVTPYPYYVLSLSHLLFFSYIDVNDFFIYIIIIEFPCDQISGIVLSA